MSHDRGMSEPSGYRPDEPRPDLPVSYPPRAAAAGHRVGRVQGVTTRVESPGSTVASQTVLAFRLVEHGSAQPREVELRGRSIAGTLQDGDWVEVAGEPGRSGRLEPERVTNLTTGSEVTALGSASSRAGRFTKAAFLVFFLLVLLAMVVLGFLAFQGFRWFDSF